MSRKSQILFVCVVDIKSWANATVLESCATKRIFTEFTEGFVVI